MKKRLTAIILCIAILLSATSVSVFAADEEYTPAQQTLYRIGEKAIQAIVGGITSIVKTPRTWVTQAEYEKTHDMTVHSTEFIDEPTPTSQWSVGYGSASLQTDFDLECYVGGSLSVTKKLATQVLDDQRVRTVAMSDGRGITVFAGVDTFGLANSEVLKIRSMLAEYAKEKNITAINISSLHQHSCVDTYGMNGDLLAAFFTAPIKNIFGIANPSGQSPKFMEHFYAAVIASVKQAVESMQTGSLYYGSVDVSEYIRDKRDPQVIDPNLNRIRFVPDRGGRETWLVNLAIHCVGMGAATTEVSGDYPYFMEKYINENANANFAMIQGAELAISSEYGDKLVKDSELIEKFGDRYASLAAYGTRLGELACSIDNDVLIKPILNYASKPFIVEANNNILLLAAKCGLLTNTIVKMGLNKFGVVSEVGYVELGDNVAIAIASGEMAPEIAFGGATTKEDSWIGESWDYKPIKDTVGNKTLLVFGITNDQIGYLLTDNSWHSFLCENEEIVASGNVAGSTFIKEYYSLYSSVKLPMPA